MKYIVVLTEEDIELIEVALKAGDYQAVFGVSSEVQKLASAQRVKQITDKLEDAKQSQV